MTATISLAEWLVDRGLTLQEADLWADFITDVLDLIDDGHALLRESSEWDLFLGGCAKSVPTEPEITSGLGDRMRRLWRDAPIDSSRNRIQVSYESPTPGDERHGIRKSKADFRFEKKFEAGFAAEFVVEAKPLRAVADIASRYMAADGLGCFLDRSPPYSREFVAGMLGYAYTQPSTWVSVLCHLEPRLPAVAILKWRVVGRPSSPITRAPHSNLSLLRYCTQFSISPKMPFGSLRAIPNGRSGHKAAVTLLQFASGRAMTMGKRHRPEAVLSGRAVRPARPHGKPGGIRVRPMNPDRNSGKS